MSAVKRVITTGAVVLAVLAGVVVPVSAGETWQEADFVDLELEVVDFVWDAARGEVHAITTATDPRYPKHLVSIRPLTGEIVSAVPFGVDPDIMAMSDDGMYVYVGLNWVGHVERVNMQTRTKDLSVKIDNPFYPAGTRVFATDVVTLENQPESFAVTVGASGNQGPTGIQVFDGSSQRPELSTKWDQKYLVRGDNNVLYGGVTDNLVESLIDGSGVASERRSGVSESDRQIADYGDRYIVFEAPGHFADPNPPNGLIVDVSSGVPVEPPPVPLEMRGNAATYDDRTSTILWSGNSKYDDFALLVEEIDPYTYLRFSRTEVAGEWGDDASWDYAHPVQLERIDDQHFVVAMENPAGLLLVNVTNAVDAMPVGVVDSETGIWALRDRWGYGTSFYYGNPGDSPFLGDWDCDGNETPGLYRQSDGYVYLRNSNSQGVADIKYFFGDPGDIPVAGDWNGDGCDTVSIYRPSEAKFYIVNELGSEDGGLGPADYSFEFGNVGDKPVAGDWDGDGIDEVGLHRESTGLFYFRNTLDTGNAHDQFIFGDPGDRFVAGDSGPEPDGVDSPAVFRPSDGRIHFRYENATGNADGSIRTGGGESLIPIAGEFSMFFNVYRTQSARQATRITEVDQFSRTLADSLLGTE